MKTRLFDDGQVVELRCIGFRKEIHRGWFNDLAALARAAQQISGKVEGVYATLNPVDPSLLARCANRLEKARQGEPSTSDRDIVARRWLPVDCDAARAAGISSTDAEHSLALDRAREIRNWLRARSWPEPILADSGNGAHLLYPIDQPNDVQAHQLVERCLKLLAMQFSDERVSIDTTVANAARIWKLYGTQACKGDSLPDRPHRLASILEAPEDRQPVSVELLMELADEMPQEPRRSALIGLQHGDGAWTRERVEDLVVRSRLPLKKTGAWDGAGKKWIFASCPWDSQHTDNSFYVLQFASGAVVAGCQHNGCTGKGLGEFRDAVEPGWREQHHDQGNGQPADWTDTAAATHTVKPQPEPGEGDVQPADLLTPRQLGDRYRAFTAQLLSSKILTGWVEVDTRIRGITPGETLTVLAKSRVGKSAFLQNFLRRLAMRGESASLWFSMEQPAHQVWERYAQMATGKNGYEIEREFMATDEEALRLQDMVEDELGSYTLTCDRSGLTMKQIEQAIDLAADLMERPVNLVAIDYLGLIDGSDLDRTLYGQVSRVARELKHLAKRKNVAVATLCQVSRAAGDIGDEPLSVNSARESGAIEEAADFLIGLYRPNMGKPETDDRMTVQVIKNRKGTDGMSFTYPFNRNSLVIGTHTLPDENRQPSMPTTIESAVFLGDRP